MIVVMVVMPLKQYHNFWICFTCQSPESPSAFWNSSSKDGLHLGPGWLSEEGSITFTENIEYNCLSFSLQVNFQSIDELQVNFQNAASTDLHTKVPRRPVLNKNSIDCTTAWSQSIAWCSLAADICPLQLLLQRALHTLRATFVILFDFATAMILQLQYSKYFLKHLARKIICRTKFSDQNISLSHKKG